MKLIICIYNSRTSLLVPADCHNFPSAGLVASTAGVPHVLPHAGPRQEVQRARTVGHGCVSVVRETGVVLLQYETVAGSLGTGGGTGGREGALRHRGWAPGGGGALAAGEALH